METGARVALKMVRPGGNLAAIRREIEALSHVGRGEHPGIVRILDHGLHQGTPWYAMEPIVGLTVDRYVARAASTSATSLGVAVASTRELGGLPQAAGGAMGTALAIVRDLCAALDYLHGEGLVHRDLKPSNVLVREDGRPVLLDLGLVWGEGGELAKAELRVQGDVEGTAEYMAPEQWRGEEGDARIDLYALGCLTHALLTGEPPFRGSMLDVMRQHLESTAPAPSALVTGVPEEIDELVARLMCKEPRERLGRAGDVASWLARLGFGEERPGLPAARPHAYRAALVGRAPEAAQLHEQLRRLIRDRRGGVVLVEGESGAGKTRLAAESARRADQAGLLVLAGACEPSSPDSLEPSGVPLQGLKRPLQTIGDRCRSCGAEETARLLGPRAPILAAIEPSLEGLPGGVAAPLPELPPEAARKRLLGSVAETLDALAAVSPVVLIVDDFQWADPLTAAFLGELAQRASDVPILAILLLRAGEGRADAIAGVTSRMTLARLPREAVGSMVADMLAVAEPSAELVDLVHEESEGNPLFVAEYVRLLVADRTGPPDREGEGGLRPSEPRGVRGGNGGAEAPPTRRRRVEGAEPWTGPPSREGEGGLRPTEPRGVWGGLALDLPRGLRSLIARRLDALPADARRVLALASVLGRELDPDLLDASCAELGFDPGGGVPILRARQFLEPSSGGALRFSHDKVREVAYGRLDAPERQAAHAAAARALEGRGTEGRAADVALLGHHWRAAGETERAFACFLAGARAAVPRGALERAEALYRTCLELSPSDATLRTVARSELAQRVLFPRHATAEALVEHGRTLEEARALGCIALEAASLRGMGACHRIMGDLARARELYEEALDRFRVCGDRSMEGRLLGVIAGVLLNQGDPPGARVRFDAALAIHRELGDVAAEAFTLGNLGLLVGEEGRLQEAKELAGRALELARRSGDRVLEMAALMRLALLDLERGELLDARVQYEAALAICREVGDRQSETVAIANLGLVHHELGNLPAAEQMIEEARKRLMESGRRADEGSALASLGSLALDRGEPERARHLLEAGVALYVRYGDRRGMGFALRDLARVHLYQGRAAAAKEILDEMRRLAGALGDRQMEGVALLGLAVAARRGAAGEEPGELIARAHALLEAAGAMLPVAMCLCESGHLALSRGAPAAPYLQRAEELVRTCGAEGGRAGQLVRELRAAIEGSLS